MPVHNTTVVNLFREMADLLELDNANRFRVGAYRDAATTIENLSESVAGLIENDADLTEIRGLGADLARRIHDIVETGTFSGLDELRQQYASTLTDLLRVPGLGPKRVQTLYSQLGIESLEQLNDAARDGKLRDLPGFGKKSEEQILEGVEQGRRKKQRRTLAAVEEEAESLEEYLLSIDGVERAVAAGSYRRKRESVGDLDIVASADRPADVIARFIEYPDIAAVQSKGKTRSSVRLRSGLQADLRVVRPESFGAALLYFTGSRPHTLVLRDRAVERDLKLNEYALYRGDDRIAGEAEAGIYHELGLPYFEPELRENRGELDAETRDDLPELIDLDDIRGDLHCHSRASDGSASIEEMARAARERGYAYLAITDHSRNLTVANGLDPDRVREQIEEIDRLNAEIGNPIILKGIEVDILGDGSLDLRDNVLQQLDIVVCSIHDHMNLTEAKQTERILRAIENPNCMIIGHPTGRLVLEREPYPINLERIMKAAADVGCALELNADPNRLDLSDVQCRMANDMGVRIVISTDAHSAAGLGNMCYGVWQARRGWLEAADILNTLPLDQLRAALRTS